MNRFSSPFRAAVELALLSVAIAPLCAQQFAPLPDQSLPAIGSSAADVVLADLDRDGDVDVVVAHAGGQNRLFRNDGHGAFTDATQALPGDANDSSGSVAAGDVDGDGDVDLLFGNAWQQNRLYLNTAGTFTDATAQRLPTRQDATQVVTLCDVDRDGDLDLLVGNQNTQNSLLLNDGKGVFTDATVGRLPADSGNTHAIVPADVDNDGDPDLVIGNDRTGNRLLLNDGKGVFTAAPASYFPFIGVATYHLAVGDVNKDGLIDILFGNGLGQNVLYRNQGAAGFVDVTTSLPASSNATFAVALADIDGDGDLDAVMGNSFGQNELWLNDGSGQFVDATSRLPVRLDATPSVALGDVDGDEDLDIVFGNNGPTQLYLNHLRHLEARGDPVRGQNWTLRVSVQTGFASGAPVALPALAAGPRTSPIRLPPLGDLRIDATSLIVLSPVAFPVPGGQVDLGFAVPQDPALKGLMVSGQALAIPSAPAVARLTNAVAVTVQ